MSEKFISISRLVGVVLLLLAMFLTWMAWTWTAFAVLIAVAVIDIFLVVKKEDTISQWIHKLFPRGVDAGIMVVIGMYTWYIWGFAGFLPVLMGIIIGHLFWNE